jgi:hypothetical protein
MDIRLPKCKFSYNGAISWRKFVKYRDNKFRFIVCMFSPGTLQVLLLLLLLLLLLFTWQLELSMCNHFLAWTNWRAILTRK